MNVLACEPLASSGERARIDAFLWPGERADAAVWEDRSGQRILVRSRVRAVDGQRRRLRVRTESASGRELDRTWFVLGEDHFVERQADGDLALPAELLRGTPVRPRPESALTVHLEYVGPARLSLGTQTEERRALLLRLGGWEQWMVEGVGEVSLGPVGEPPHRWLVGWRGGDDRLFAAARVQRGKAAT